MLIDGTPLPTSGSRRLSLNTKIKLPAYYEAQRPTVTNISPFANGSRDVSPGTDTLSLTFSEPMNTYFRNFDFGPLGEEAAVRIQKVFGWTEDRRFLMGLDGG